jgi:hypothetical protein
MKQMLQPHVDLSMDQTRRSLEITESRKAALHDILKSGMTSGTALETSLTRHLNENVIVTLPPLKPKKLEGRAAVLEAARQIRDKLGKNFELKINVVEPVGPRVSSSQMMAKDCLQVAMTLVASHTNRDPGKLMQMLEVEKSKIAGAEKTAAHKAREGEEVATESDSLNKKETKKSANELESKSKMMMPDIVVPSSIPPDAIVHDSMYEFQQTAEGNLPGSMKDVVHHLWDLYGSSPKSTSTKNGTFNVPLLVIISSSYLTSPMFPSFACFSWIWVRTHRAVSILEQFSSG